MEGAPSPRVSYRWDTQQPVSWSRFEGLSPPGNHRSQAWVLGNEDVLFHPPTRSTRPRPVPCPEGELVEPGTVDSQSVGLGWTFPYEQQQQRLERLPSLSTVEGAELGWCAGSRSQKGDGGAQSRPSHGVIRSRDTFLPGQLTKAPDINPWKQPFWCV